MATKKITLNELRIIVKKIINEEYDTRPSVNTDFIEIEVNPMTKDFEIFKKVIDGGIDSHLEGFVKSDFGYRNYKSIGKRAYFNFHKSEKDILLRRLNDIYLDTDDEDVFNWIEDIENYNH
jgi:hypothetical protein